MDSDFTPYLGKAGMGAPFTELPSVGALMSERSCEITVRGRELRTLSRVELRLVLVIYLILHS